jgi:hypothetical protein
MQVCSTPKVGSVEGAAQMSDRQAVDETMAEKASVLPRYLGPVQSPLDRARRKYVAPSSIPSLPT